MKKIFTLSFIFFCVIQLHSQSSFDRQTVNIGNIGLSVSNAGTIGRPDVVGNPQGEPSMEYPINSGVEHLFEGGLWIGAQVNGQVAVSTGAIDASTGYTTGGSGFEFTSGIGSSIQQKSTLTYSDHFSTSAISHQDMVMDFTDANTIVPGTSTPIQDHTLPLGAGVHLETYAWNYSFADYFVIMNYTITNNSSNTWDSVYLGMWTDLVVRNVNVATDNGAAFFNKGGGGFIDSLYSLYAFDVNGDPGYTGSYGATQFLGIEWRNQFVHPHNAANLIAAGYPIPLVNANFWNFKTFDGSQYGAPANDVERYLKMKKGLDFTDQSVVTFIQNPNNRTQLLSVGPLVHVAPGESFTFVIAMVCAHQLDVGGTTGPTMDVPFARNELFQHLNWAKRTYLGEDVNENGVLDAGEDLIANNNLDRYILPEPPSIPKLKVVTENNGVILYWDDAAENSIDPISKKLDFEGYRLYRSNVGDDLTHTDLINASNLIGQWDKQNNAIGFNNGFDPIKLPAPVQFDGDTTHYTYKYEMNGLLNGWQYMVILTSFDEGDDALNLGSLESSFIANAVRIFPGTDNMSITKNDSSSIGVYPNPYRQSAAWNGNSDETRKIIFYNLPSRCTITVYTSAGDVVAQMEHNSSDYNGSDAQWFANYAGNPDQRIFSGGEHAWDILSESKQIISQGIYLFSVKDLDTGMTRQGNLVIMK